MQQCRETGRVALRIAIDHRARGEVESAQLRGVADRVGEEVGLVRAPCSVTRSLEHVKRLVDRDARASSERRAGHGRHQRGGRLATDLRATVGSHRRVPAVELRDAWLARDGRESFGRRRVPEEQGARAVVKGNRCAARIESGPQFLCCESVDFGHHGGAGRGILRLGAEHIGARGERQDDGKRKDTFGHGCSTQACAAGLPP